VFVHTRSAVTQGDAYSQYLLGASGYSKHTPHGGAVYLYERVPQVVPYHLQHHGAAASRNASGDDFDDWEDREDTYAWALSGLLVSSALHAYAYFGHTVVLRDSVGE
jgi:hypothetical protein